MCNIVYAIPAGSPGVYSYGLKGDNQRRGASTRPPLAQGTTVGRYCCRSNFDGDTTVGKLVHDSNSVSYSLALIVFVFRVPLWCVVV